ncbi:hypothetical protein WICPIJ_002881 [Wickerhamomyces pijperi]|uniref:Uncharacterized protein n=1 Tax=Wickerhamomyces pijperi TaxID=599730 RepID=A0A9P8Q8R6_WICPI|nr:hypothetical protein WICPIJ_002881 [Wickerhamomyces pijperi]
MDIRSVSNGYNVVSVLHSRIKQLPSLLTESNIESYFTPYGDQSDGSFHYTDTLRKILNYLTDSYTTKTANGANVLVFECLKDVDITQAKFKAGIAACLSEEDHE